MKHWKGYILVVLLISSALVLTGCFGVLQSDAESKDASASEESSKQKKDNDSSASNLGDYNIWFGGEVSERDGKFVIEGKSNLIPGSRLTGEVIVNDGEVYTDTTEIVEEDGSFYMELNHHQYGKADIVVKFLFNSVQNDEVFRHYGEKGRNLEGPFIYKHGRNTDIYNKAEFSVSYDPNEEFGTKEIEAPEWYALPDDYGDPRVWIEVDELTNDQDYFYIHGRTNLLEGSRILGFYGSTWRTSDTRIKPDGSFDLKIEYEYREDTPISIQFLPYQNQWNMIEEAYGKNGDKMVGNLIRTARNNSSRQLAELLVDIDSFEQ